MKYEAVKQAKSVIQSYTLSIFDVEERKTPFIKLFLEKKKKSREGKEKI